MLWKEYANKMGRGKSWKSAKCRNEEDIVISAHLRLHHIHESKTKNTFSWKTTLLITGQLHRHYLGL